MAEEFIALRVAQRQQFALNPGEVMRMLSNAVDFCP
jgi:hypothetical protein